MNGNAAQRGVEGETMTEKELQEIDARIAELEAQKLKIDEEISHLRRKIGESKMAAAMDVTPENSMRVWLDTNTRTTLIMSEFYNSNKKFLVIPQIIFLTFDPLVTTNIALVITKYNCGIQYTDSGMTITDLKQNGNFLVTQIKEIATSNFKNRMSALYRELYKVVTKPINSGDKILFEHPVRLGAQTYDNQMSYGKTYYDYSSCNGGILNSETTGFIIIGIIVED